MHEEHDIVARFASQPGSHSVGALAAYLGRSCGHVSLDDRVVRQGYRFYPWMSDEIPHFFNKRFSTGSTNLAVTLQAGLGIDGHDPLDGCTTTAEARSIIEGPDYHASFWLARVTIGSRMYEVEEISDPIFIAKHPNEFRAIADELVALGILQVQDCPLCSTAG